MAMKRLRSHAQSSSARLPGSRYRPIPNELFISNRTRLAELMVPNSLAVLNANDVLPTNADGSLRLIANSDLFYLTGLEQEQTILLLYPDAHDE